MESSHFDLHYGNHSFPFEKHTLGFGEFYPYRDVCDKSGDPECASGQILYYMSTLVPESDSGRIEITGGDWESEVFSRAIQFHDRLELYKKDISCVGGNE